MTENEHIKFLENALIECYDAAIPQSAPWTNSPSEKAEYAAKTLPQHMRGLNRLLEHHSQRAQWQPIETYPLAEAPYVLIGWFYYPGQRSMTVSSWHSTRKCWCNTWMAFTADPNNQPTHWMHLPEPPEPLTDLTKPENRTTIEPTGDRKL